MFENIKKDFPMFKNNKEMQGNPFVYLDNAATTFKPQCVIDACNEYYLKFNSNSHRGDYDIENDVDQRVDDTRELVANFINAEKNEVVFTSGTTASLNLISYAYCRKYLKSGDEILITEAEHASNVLPWLKLQEIGVVVKFIPLTESGELTVSNFEKAITNKTKFVSIAHITNVLGYKADVKNICKIAHKHGIIVSIDGAQSVPHMKTDVKDLDCDFLSFSGHKMCGPTGIGVLYGKIDLLNSMDAFMTGGGMNVTFDTKGNYKYLNSPERFEAGTLNLEAIYGFKKTIEYLSQLGMDNIEKYEKELKSYAISKLKENKNIILYSADSDSGIITFNYKNVFAQDEATYLNSKGICVRSGQHCAKILNQYLNIPATLRASLYFYNDKNDVDALVKALEKGDEFLDAYFN